MTNDNAHIGPDLPPELQISGDEIPEVVPILTLDNFVLFPYMIAPIAVSSTRNKLAVNEVLKTEKKILAAFTRKRERTAETREKTAEQPKECESIFDLIYHVGCAANILRMLKMPDDSMRILVHGLKRVKLVAPISQDPFPLAKIEIINEPEQMDREVEAMIKNAQSLLHKIISAMNLPEELAVVVMNINEPGKLADLIATNLNLKIPELQSILETFSPKERLQKVLVILNRELELLELSQKIQTQVKGEVERGQREYFLREQLKAIQKELGEVAETPEIAELRKKIEQKAMPDYVREVCKKELERLAMMHPSSAEYTVGRTYLDWLISLPWLESTEDNIDIKWAQKVLDEDHYNLEKVKERILEYLAVIKLKKGLKGPILCFVGPPGVGKTSLGRSIARALGRKFYRMSLGGVRDEAELRGHRRTYIGALPGRIIKALKECGSNNPVLMLDEVDKLGMDFRGDPASALLEVLDPEQNCSFVDHYIDVPFDLSKVMFITTANWLDPIPAPLRDRMEVLSLPGYTLREKLEIARRYLVPREIENSGLEPKNIKFTQKALQKIIEEYTLEAGVRNLQREIGNICRKVAKRFASGETKPELVTENKVAKFLGPQKFFSQLADRMTMPGVAIGLAWTQTGGDILFIEATATTGGGKLILTGQLGEVMKESAQAALTYIHSNCEQLHIPEEKFTKQDIHVHVPAGAIPKDGPSAGISICTAIASLMTGILVKDKLAMTGEITLKGNVLPIGGVKQKVLAAHRAGITEIILPAKNKNDLEEIPSDIRNQIKFYFVTNMEEVLKLALRQNPFVKEDKESLKASAS
ncbi:MAG: endopeptidase La [Candidatus Sumerlaeia bacterium]|nr:endopeptidase La [Candidatus Sumerlaeia bacterium]